MNRLEDDLDHLHCLIGRLVATNGLHYLRDCGSSGWPTRGVYFFFENERLGRGDSPRVVRVGTHALREGEGTTLWSRLRAHRGTQAGALAGGGNHRASVFRQHVGRALMKSGRHPTILPSWDVGRTADRRTRDAELDLEREVSRYIGGLPFTTIEIADPAGPGSVRGIIERGAIALLSAAARQHLVRAEDEWLGFSADRDAISESLLWNVKHVNERYDPSFLGSIDALTTVPTDLNRLAPSRASTRW
jgi:hypothetical protein